MGVLDDAGKLIETRLRELEQEAEKLKQALSHLGGGTGRRGGRSKGKSTAKRVAPKRSGSGRGGGRADQAVELIQDNPGITAGEVAKKLKIKPNYLYRVLGQLEKEGRVKKEGRKYRAA